MYLITIVLGAAEELLIRGRIFVPKDAVATTANLRSMEFLWRLGIASEMFLGICTVIAALILYALLRPVSRDLALLMTFFGLVAVAVEAAYSLHLVEALFPVGHAAYLKAFTPDQLAAMASLSIRRRGLLRRRFNQLGDPQQWKQEVRSLLCRRQVRSILNGVCMHAPLLMTKRV